MCGLGQGFLDVGESGFCCIGPIEGLLTLRGEGKHRVSCSRIVAQLGMKRW